MAEKINFKESSEEVKDEPEDPDSEHELKRKLESAYQQINKLKSVRDENKSLR